VHKVCCFVIVCYNKPIIFVNSNNRSVFIMEAQCVFCESELDYSIACNLIRVTCVFRGGDEGWNNLFYSFLKMFLFFLQFSCNYKYIFPC